MDIMMNVRTFDVASEQANKTKIRGDDGNKVKINIKSVGIFNEINLALYSSNGQEVENGLIYKQEDLFPQNESMFFVLNAKLNRPKKIDENLKKITAIEFYIKIEINGYQYRSNFFKIHTNQNQFQNLKLVKRRFFEKDSQFDRGLIKKFKSECDPNELKNIKISLEQIERYLNKNNRILEDIIGNISRKTKYIYTIGLDKDHNNTLEILGEKVGFKICDMISNNIDYVLINTKQLRIKTVLDLFSVNPTYITLNAIYNSALSGLWEFEELPSIKFLFKNSKLTIDRLSKKNEILLTSAINSIEKEEFCNFKKETFDIID